MLVSRRAGTHAATPEEFYEHRDTNRHRTSDSRARETHQESYHRRSPYLVSRLWRLRGPRRLLQGPRETPGRSREDRYPRRHRLLLALSLFREWLRRPLYPWPRRPNGI